MGVTPGGKRLDEVLHIEATYVMYNGSIPLISLRGIYIR